MYADKSQFIKQTVYIAESDIFYYTIQFNRSSALLTDAENLSIHASEADAKRGVFLCLNIQLNVKNT